MVAQHCKCAKCHWAAHFQVVIFTLCKFHPWSNWYIREVSGLSWPGELWLFAIHYPGGLGREHRAWGLADIPDFPVFSNFPASNAGPCVQVLRFLWFWFSAPWALSLPHLSISSHFPHPRPGPLQRPVHTGWSILSGTSFRDDQPIVRGSEPGVIHLVQPLVQVS